ncbi:hypothetical protein D0Z07_7389 [Hyphodiscus hymeniophilus]|uniref:Uncharacterized protein n=1 Tax=Hyphodiscus hymeniophilus TaxID=353542 RepID=A0A9P6VES9_9HELO|nr:hypothetical protein D0Z07_7389 [Hyphodiscus hymeniophilus]
MMADITRRKPMPPGYDQPAQPAIYSHSRTRTTSSNTFPTILYPQQQQQPPQFPKNMQVHTYTSRRTPSTTTFSTTASSGNGPVPFRNSQDLRRSTSSRSGGLGQPTGYVALMRKQKATVWCDRAQHEDPRLLAAQRAAKARATMEVIGGPGPGRVSTGGGSNSLAGSNRVTAKIRHHGKAGLVGYSPGDLVGGVGGVPMRLSASEVEGGDSDDDDAGSGKLYHQRTGSGRSSLGSGRKGLTYRQSGASSATGRWSSGNTPPSERERLDSMEDVAEAGETPVPSGHPKTKDYFTSTDGNGDGTASTGSGSSGERNDNVGDLGTTQIDAARLASNSLLKSSITREKSSRNPEDLRRRGSVDERTMTMSAQRLYIANPDEDSD